MSPPKRNDPCPCGSGRKYKQCCLKQDEGFASGVLSEVALASQKFHAALAHQQAGHLLEAVASYKEALLLDPGLAEAHCNLGVALEGQGNRNEAINNYRQALLLKPDFAQAYNNLGNVLQYQGKLDEAVQSLHMAVSLRPNYAEAHFNLGNALRDQGRLDEAIKSYHNALAFKPEYAQAHNNLGNIFKEQGRLPEAAESYCQAILLKPDFAEAHNNLGNARHEQGNLIDAAESYNKALALKPNYAEAHSNLGGIFIAQGKLDEATQSLQMAILLNPNYAEAYSNLGNAFRDQGKLNEAIESYRQALRLKPNFHEAYSNLLMTLQFSPRFTLSEIFAEHKRFAEQFETPLKPLWPEHRNVRDPGKRLKVGYVSADFRRHAVAFFIEPVLANHDPSQIELFCYYSHTLHDDITERIRSIADHWVPCKGISDAQLAERIVADGIDILVDLSGHTANNRLLVFARKPAPIQITYLGYPGTSGLSAMNYRITDRYANPEGSDIYYSEKLLRLPDSLCCYSPPADMPDIEPLPALSNGYITFGSLNNYNKINDQCLELWAALLKTVSTSRLLMLTVPEGAAQKQLAEKFAELGIPAERLELHGKLSSGAFLKMFRCVDIALDPFPVTGGTTTCESLWMGVPVIVLVGQRYISRVGYSFLSAAGLRDFATFTPEDYLRVAIYLADNIPLLAEIHDNMQTGVAASPLADTVTFTRNLEAAYRHIWIEYCRGDPKAHEHSEAQ